MKAGLCLLLAASGLHFQVMDGRGKETSAVTLESGAPDEDGWRAVRVVKAKGDAVLVWPFDGLAKAADGPEPIRAIVIQRGDSKALLNAGVAAAIATPMVLGVASVEEIAMRTGLTTAELTKAVGDLVNADDAFAKGVGLLYAGKFEGAAAATGVALRERERQLTRVPSEIYAAAVLDGLALYRTGKFDDAAVAYLRAVEQRPSDAMVRKLRADALIRAGKGEAAGR